MCEVVGAYPLATYLTDHLQRDGAKPKRFSPEKSLRSGGYVAKEYAISYPQMQGIDW